MSLHRARQLVRSALAALLLLAALPLSAAAAFTWLLPTGGETWGTDHVHTILWSGGPAAPVNIYLVDTMTNTVAQVVALGDVNDGERQFRLSNTLAPGTYLLYIEDVAATDWSYGPQFQVQVTPPCIAPCTQGAFGAPLVVCGQTHAEADSLATALAMSHIACGMAGNVDISSISIELTLVTVGGYPCPAPYGGAYVVEASAVWCCCHEPLPAISSTWTRVKALYRDHEE